jgi:hypothetical protein
VIIKDSTVETATTVSQLTLQALEQIVERGKDAFIEMGKALAKIHERKLYKETHKTWEAYLKERWNFSRQHAHRLLQAKKVAEMSPVVGDKPRTEREARKRLGEKRSKRKQLAKAAQPSKPAQPSIVIEDLDLEVEFTASTERVELWAAEFAQEDYLRLVRRVTTYTGELLSEAGYTDDQRAKAEVTA